MLSDGVPHQAASERMAVFAVVSHKLRSRVGRWTGLIALAALAVTVPGLAGGPDGAAAAAQARLQPVPIGQTVTYTQESLDNGDPQCAVPWDVYHPLQAR